MKHCTSVSKKAPAVAATPVVVGSLFTKNPNEQDQSWLVGMLYSIAQLVPVVGKWV